MAHISPFPCKDALTGLPEVRARPKSTARLRGRNRGRGESRRETSPARTVRRGPHRLDGPSPPAPASASPAQPHLRICAARSAQRTGTPSAGVKSIRRFDRFDKIGRWILRSIFEVSDRSDARKKRGRGGGGPGPCGRRADPRKRCCAGRRGRARPRPPQTPPCCAACASPPRTRSAGSEGLLPGAPASPPIAVTAGTNQNECLLGLPGNGLDSWPASTPQQPS